MEIPTSVNQQSLISSFMEIAVTQTNETAITYLKATSWNLEEALNLFLISKPNEPSLLPYQEEEQIPIPIPSKKDTLYDCSSMSAPIQVSPEEIWDSESDPSSSDSRLSSLFRPPRKLLFQGTFEEAKSTSSRENLWLLVNLQSTTEFASHTLNRDLWSNEAVSQAIESSFILWQVYDHTIHGQKISTFYRIESVPPVVLLIDPITGQKIRSWIGAMEAQSFVEDLMKYMESGPHEHIASQKNNKRMKTEEEEEDTCSSSNHIDHIVEVSLGEKDTCLGFPDLTEEPKGDKDPSLVCSVCVRFPDGRRKQRKFLKTEPIQLLWSFCYSQMDESEIKSFKLVQAIPGASKTLDYGANITFEQSEISNSMISLTWE